MYVHRHALPLTHVVATTVNGSVSCPSWLVHRLPWSDCMHALTAHDVVWRDMTVMMCVWGMPRCNSSKFHDVMVQQGHPHKLRPVYHAIERYFT